MRRFWIILLLFVTLIAVGCESQGASPTTETTMVPETTVQTEPTVPTTIATEPVETQPLETEPPAPQTKPATAIADDTQIVVCTLDRGETVEVVGDYDERYVIVLTKSGYGLVDRALLYLSDAPAFEQWNGYAYSGAKLYSHYLRFPNDAQSLNMNTAILVLAEYGNGCVVQVGDTVGYMRRSEISKHYIQYTPDSGSQDGGDISMQEQWKITLLANVLPQEGTPKGNAAILVDDAEVILGWYERGEQVLVIDEEGYAPQKEGFLAVWVHDALGYVREELLLIDGDEAYVSWTGFARYNAGVYEDYYLTGEPVTTLSTNQRVQILWDLGNCYMVQLGEEICFMLKTEVSETEIVYGGNTGGGEWSDPVM